ncbi:MAG: uridine diphosphate-N-acetylglucosamine-binding protein YvcK [Anaerolineales bacterium]|nr:uridine diphosphate-N-acetylglucosamine-binding protein YvcK [Anaerolineales bacterium]
MRKNSRRDAFSNSLRLIGRWFAPGLGVKRWYLVVLLGVTMLGIGLAIFLLDLYRTDSTNPVLLTILSYASLRFLPRFLRVAIFGGLGIGVVVFGIWQLNRSLLRPYVRPGRPLVEELANYRRRERGPRIVTIGGGHGLATLLRGLKAYTRNLTAVVTVADDGGSSGRLRESFGILPPGDIRNCLAALSNDEQMLTQLFQYRFSGSGNLDGHSFGNLFITALADITGSFEGAIAESGKVLSVSGRVLPSTLHNVRLVADMQLPNSLNQVRVQGESRIPKMAGRVQRVWLEPNDAPAYPPVIKAILSADMIVVGPGSLYTSLLPNLLVQDLLGAVQSSRAVKVYVSNIATQKGETDLYSCYDHVRVLEEHVGDRLFDVLLCNDNYQGQLLDDSQWVRADEKNLSDSRVRCANLIDTGYPWRHDSKKLAEALITILAEYTGPLE